MKQLTVNVPDHSYTSFLEYIKNIPEASLIFESNFILSKNHLDQLEKSSNFLYEDCLTRAESNEKLKKKNAI